ncbi:thioredoxin family protein [Glaciibacter psychrotolerans]|uniref:Protein-disulfide isomerase n=1 Tax=Glaciibacter psychrotolerans TaxID=670054 RepID=A0A7Z0J5R0_9MICO|nr:thioredoxin family protein [Leifsonia psychrotolerans]NYJ19144.1 protein-disulfide isomerase [Leifsonia psychrotolerans]
MDLVFFSSAFCEPCLQTREVLAEVARMVPNATVSEFDVARDNAEAEANGIRSTPTVLVRNASGVEVFRAVGAPTLDQVLVAAAKAI